MTSLLLSFAFSTTFQAPVPPERADEKADRYLPPLVACAAADGYDVEFVSLPADVYVLGDHVNLMISVNEALDGTGRVGALVYQLAYNYRPSYLSKPDQEVFAEGVSGSVLALLGLPTTESDAYLQRFPRAAAVLAGEKKNIDSLASAIHGCMTRQVKGGTVAAV